ncbi:MAG TPA: hypothetical protein VIT43_15485 [Candidatus Dormibacteraeota bacterium]
MRKGKPFFIGRGSALGRIHPYALYEAFGIPSQRWLSALARQVAANEDERAAIGRYLSNA